MPSRDETLAVVISIVIALLVVTFAVIAGTGLEAPAQGSAPGPSCAEWTDGCVVCRRVPEGLACSTPGIACTPGAQRCVRPAGVPI